MIRLIAIFIIVFSVLAPAAAFAQDSDYTGFMQRLARANRIQPMQNPEYKNGTDILNWRILDRTNKVVGEVNDMVLNDSGAIASVEVDFNRLRLGEAYLDYRTLRLRPATNGYVMGFNAEQISTLYPTMLSQIETAAGPDAEAVSMKDLIGATVRSDDGRTLGEVENVFFTGNGTRAAALYVGMSYKMHRGKAAAVPFDLVSYNIGRFNGVNVVMSADQADALIDFLDQD